MNKSEIKKIVDNISFVNTCVDMGYKFKIKENTDGFLLQASFKRPDTNSGKIGIGYGREMFISRNADERSIVFTAWVAIKLIVEHELLEAFRYKGIRILDPHKSLNELAFPSSFVKAYKKPAKINVDAISNVKITKTKLGKVVIKEKNNVLGNQG